MASKLQQLSEITGMSEMEMLESATFDSVAEGICMVKGCDGNDTVEPDQTRGVCPICGRNSVASCLAIAGII